MYPRRLSQSLLSSAQHNLNININRSLLSENVHKDFFIKCSQMIRQKIHEVRNFKEVNRRFQEFLKNGKLYKLIAQLPKSKNDCNVLKIWVHHCECVFAQRIRRYHQMVCLYSKWWEEQALKDLFLRMRQSLAKKGRLTIAGVGISSYNWDGNKIPDETLKARASDLDYIYVLKENTICLACDETNKETTKSYVCKCGTSKVKKVYEEWSIFVEKDDLIIWRRLNAAGLYEYKVFGSYDDISAEDFLSVQVDTDYRKKWDDTAVMLEVVETDPQSNSDVLYWEMLWPRLFANRDYVFNRRYLIDPDKNLIYLINKTTEHAKYPKYSEKYRIDDYYSCMVIKPNTDMSQPGLEFSLTYYDNPGLNVPSSITTWVTMKAMPDFLQRLREATRHYRQYCKTEGVSEKCKIIREEERIKDEQRIRDQLDYCSLKRRKINPGDQYDFKSGNFAKKIDDNPSETNSTPPSAGVQPNNDSFWKYFHLYYYFH